MAAPQPRANGEAQPAAAAPLAGTKTASYHAPPLTGPTGATVHVLRCLTSAIHCGFHLGPHIAKTVAESLPASAYVLITDTNIAALHLAAFQESFNAALKARHAALNDASAPMPRFLWRTIPPGETSKSRETKAELEDWLLSQRITRDAVILALGGGVIGDLVGFVAATFMRGVKFVQIPTTLLAMVDSAVGGKTAIDTPLGKNLVGAFHQPNFIFIDAAYLETLPEREFSNGMAEVVKTAAIWDATDFAKLESKAVEIRHAVLSRDAKAPAFQGRTLETRTEAQSLLLDVIRGSVGVKAHIVTIDEKETGLRNLVNFGHSIGHAIEAVLTPDMLHGECISVGMILEAEIARSMYGLSQVAVGRLTRCLKEYNLPVSMSDPRITRLSRAANLSVDRLLDIMRVDKKNAGSVKKIVLLSHIGGTVEEKASSVPDDIIRRVLSAGVRVQPVLSKPSKAKVTMSTPGSKSISNRALVLAALAKGTCRLRNLLHSDDTQVMMAALHDLKAASFEWADGGETIVVTGNEGKLSRPVPSKEIYLQNAGTAARFMTTVCALVGGNAPVVITGNKRMKERPIGALVDALSSNGVAIKYLEGQNCLPLAIQGPGNGLAGGRIELSATISSQYVSSILLCAPYASEEVVLDLVGGAVISQPYIDMTIAMMAAFGIEVERLTDSSGKPLNTYRIPRGHYVSPAEYDIESDASSATYPLAIAAITGTECTIPNIGSASLQGDAMFAKSVLEPMGCEVVQTATSTTVRGPPIGQLRQVGGNLDMEPMTDAFLTASVLLAVAAKPSSSGAASTRIIGIANQRVKECNRIRAMMDELAKFGVRTVEHEDGLEIFGVPHTSLNAGVSVHCYDDHRVAMAFSVLATLAPAEGAVIEEKRCVEKTWPNWWDDLERNFGISVEGIDLPKASTSALGSATAPLGSLETLAPSDYPADATIFCIGMRASGKTYLGALGAAALQRPFLDADAIFDDRYGLKGFVAQHGWPAFRQKETELLTELMETKAKGHVVSLGGGVVETAENRELLKEYARTKGPVIHVVRDADEICAFLETSDRPAYGEPVRDVIKRRMPWLRECSSHQLVNRTTANASTAPAGSAEAMSLPPSAAASIRPVNGARSEVGRFFRFIAGLPLAGDALQAAKSGRQTFFLSLTFPDVLPALPLIEQITAGADAIEFRVDLLSPTGTSPTQPSVPPHDFVAQQLAALRQHTSLPIVFTVRTQSQGGMFPDSAQAEYFELLKLGLRLGCEYVDMEVRWDEAQMQAAVAHKGFSKIIASWHDWSGAMKWDSAATLEKYALTARFGDIAKLVGKATTPADNLALEAFRVKVAALPDAKPLLAINMGTAGQLSRVLNPILSPITHAAMPTRAAPGQLTFAEVQQARHLIGLLPAKRFALFGTPIAHSLSPCLHNTAFQALGLPHRYDLFETKEVDASIQAVIRSPDFGGASVTIPHKLNIMPLLDEVTADAKAIGAVNTIVPVAQPGQGGGGGATKLVGDNTDWIAITELIRRNLRAAPEALTALVIGAGGSARAAIYSTVKLGASTVLLYNRTLENAQRLAKELPKEWNVVVVEDLAKLPLQPRVIISNVPAEGTSIAGTSGASTTGVVLPPSILSSPLGGVVIDMSYKPSFTPLMELVSRLPATPPDRWVAIPGLTILLEQGCHQFLRWTGVEAPRAAVEAACWKLYRSRD